MSRKLKKKFSLLNLIFCLVQVVTDNEEDPLDFADYRIEENSDGSTSYVMIKIEEGVESTFFEELDVGERNTNNSDDDDHCITYAKEVPDVGDNSINKKDDDDQCITVKNENEPVSTRKLYLFKSYFHFFAA